MRLRACVVYRSTRRTIPIPVPCNVRTQLTGAPQSLAYSRTHTQGIHRSHGHARNHTCTTDCWTPSPSPHVLTMSSVSMSSACPSRSFRRRGRMAIGVCLPCPLPLSHEPTEHHQPTCHAACMHMTIHTPMSNGRGKERCDRRRHSAAAYCAEWRSLLPTQCAPIAHSVRLPRAPRKRHGGLHFIPASQPPCCSPPRTECAE